MDQAQKVFIMSLIFPAALLISLIALIGLFFVVVHLFKIPPASSLPEFIPSPPIPHDPEDLKSGPGATTWTTVEYCPVCANIPSHEERMAGICNSCGSAAYLGDFRSYRKIFNGDKWVFHIRYGSVTVISDDLFWDKSLPSPRNRRSKEEIRLLFLERLKAYENRPVMATDQSKEGP